MLTINKINELSNDTVSFIHKSEEAYHEKISAVVDEIIKDKNKKIICVAGPSASGKTTTSGFLAKELKKRGVEASVVSLDNFYGAEEDMPRLPDGRADYETVYALDLKEVERAFKEIISVGKTDIPVFDFLKHKRSDKRQIIDITNGGILIVEGLHAINPVIYANLPQESIFKIYISVNQSIYNEDGSVALKSHQLRFIRRLCRDSVYRSSDAKNTLRLWTMVVAGERKYLYHLKYTADATLVTLHEYEPCLFKNIALKLLENLPLDSENYEEAMYIKKVLEGFNSIDPSLVPKTSLMQEFI